MRPRLSLLMAASALVLIACQNPAPALKSRSQDHPVLIVTASYPGANAQVVADSIAAPLELEIVGVEGLVWMESQSGNNGKYIAYLHFAPKTDVNAAAKLLRSRLGLARPLLPEALSKEGLVLRLQKPQPARDTVTLALIDHGQHDWKTLQKTARELMQQLVKAGALRNVQVFPHDEKQLSANIDRTKCMQLGVPLTDVTRALRQPHANMDEWKKTPVTNKVSLGQVATIKEVMAPSAVYRVDLHPAVRVTGLPPASQSCAVAAGKCLALARADLKRLSARDIVVQDMANLPRPPKHAANVDEPTLEVKYQYLLVNVAGPAAWKKTHRFFIRWKGKSVAVPVVFRVPGRAENFKLCSAGEKFGHLLIGDEKVPVLAKPDTKFDVRNTLSLIFLNEASPRKNVVAFSIGSLVLLCPSDNLGELGPNAKVAEMQASGASWEKELKKLVADGKVIEIMAPSALGIASENEREAFRRLPDFPSPAYRVDPYIAFAAHLQAAGQERAKKVLLDLAKDEQHGDNTVILCRMLFTAKAKGKFRRMGLGGAWFLGNTDYADWPLEPIELVDNVPFLIVRGFTLEGLAEAPSSYVEYCVHNCAWRTQPFKSQTQSAKKKALKKLLASPKWRTPLPHTEKQFLADQIK
ncbi:MAG TPA: efflux RND transporter permease subunit [Gemmataceae bacterium]|nr:efflux RND transporter permease subunit [Gemmataceae bacterium]